MSVNFLPFCFPGIPAVRCVFQTRTGGVSCGGYAGGNISFQVGDDPQHVAANRQSLAGVLRAQGMDCWAELEQVHGDGMVFEPEATDVLAANLAPGDGMATSRPALPCSSRQRTASPFCWPTKADAMWRRCMRAGAATAAIFPAAG